MSKIVQTPTNIKNRTRKALQRGFSNVQIAIGILITVILLLGALSGYQYIQQAKVNNEVAMITDLRASTIRYGLVAGAFSDTNETVGALNGLNFFDTAGLHVTGTGTNTKVTNQWGAELSVSTSADAITFKFGGIPSSACADLAPKALNIVKELKVGPTASTAIVTKTTTDFKAACAGATNSASSFMDYTISR